MTHQFPAAFRRLCVETANMGNINGGSLPAAFRRLCVETILFTLLMPSYIASRLQAAVC